MSMKRRLWVLLLLIVLVLLTVAALAEGTIMPLADEPCEVHICSADGQTCDKCGLPYDEDNVNHQLISSNPEDYEFDENEHWFRCNCGQKQQVSFHERNCTESVCRICDKPYTGPNKTHPAEAIIWDLDDTNHWHMCLACPDTWDTGAHVKDCDSQSDICRVCLLNYTGSNVTHGDYIYKSDDSQHRLECERCGDIKSGPEDHVPNSDGTACTVCGKVLSAPGPEETENPNPEETNVPNPEETENPNPEETEKPDPEETENPDPDETEEPGPGETDGPSETDEPEAPPAPSETDEPDETSTPGGETDEPIETPSPAVTDEPEETPTPAATEEPEESEAPGSTDEPETTPAPSATVTPEASASPDVTTTPAATRQAGTAATVAPAQSGDSFLARFQSNSNTAAAGDLFTNLDETVTLTMEANTEEPGYAGSVLTVFAAGSRADGVVISLSSQYGAESLLRFRVWQEGITEISALRETADFTSFVDLAEALVQALMPELTADDVDTIIVAILSNSPMEDAILLDEDLDGELVGYLVQDGYEFLLVLRDEDVSLLVRQAA